MIAKERKNYKFKDLCSKISRSWAIEANALIWPLMDKFRNENQIDDQVEFDERRALFGEMLHLHARFEAESSRIKYFWPHSGDVFDQSKHESWTPTGVVHFTKRFGVIFIHHDGETTLYLKALVVTIDPAMLSTGKE